MSNPDYELLQAVARDGSRRALTARPIFVDLGAEVVAFDADSGALTLAFVVGEQHLQGHGVVAGGVIGTMLDFAMSLPVLGTLPPMTPFATATYSVNLIAALKPGPVIAEGRIDRIGSRLAFTSATLMSGDRLVANASSTIVILPTPAKGPANG